MNEQTPTTQKKGLSKAQIQAQKNYRKKEDVKKKYATKKNTYYKNISTTFLKAEAEYIQSIFKMHNLKPSEILRGAAAALVDGENIRTQTQPLAIPAEAAPSAETKPTEATTTEESND